MQSRNLKVRIAELLPVRTRLYLSQLKKGELPSQQAFAERVNRILSKKTASTDGSFTGAAFRPKRAKVVQSYDVWEERKESTHEVIQVLTQHHIEFALMPEADGKKLIVIRNNDREKALRALNEELAFDDAWHLSVNTRRSNDFREPIDLARVGESSTLPKSLVKPGEFFLFRNKIAQEGSAFVSPDFGAVLSFWNEVEESGLFRADGMTYEVGTVMAPNPNGIAAYLSPSSWIAANDSEVHWPASASKPHIYELTEPIDVVYTWVDGDDLAWQKRKNAALGKTDDSELNDTAAIDSRFVSRNELLYSLRSIEMYANWVRNIYIVTDQQTPEWLDTSNPRIHVVDHKDIFTDQSVLPVFNSHAIESQLHHIEGLSDRFLYMNDDFLFGNSVQASDFFHANGITKFFPSKAALDVAPASSRDLPVLSAAKRNRELIAQTFGVTVTNKFRHTPMPLRKDVFTEMEERFPDLFAEVSASKFRHPDDYSIPSALYYYYAYATARAVPGRISYGYQDIAQPELILFLNRLVRDRPFKVFCLNDTNSTPEQISEQAELIGAAMEQCFPFKSSFEI